MEIGPMAAKESVLEALLNSAVNMRKDALETLHLVECFAQRLCEAPPTEASSLQQAARDVPKPPVIPHLHEIFKDVQQALERIRVEIRRIS